MSESKDKPIEKRIVVYCCDSNGEEFAINYFPQEEALIFAFDLEDKDASTMAVLFSGVDVKDFVELQYLLVMLGEHLTTSMVHEKGIMFVEKVEVQIIKREELEELA